MLTIMGSPDRDGLDDIFKALGNKHRRAIVNALGLQPHSIGQLAETEHLSLPAIHKHIELLESAKLVQRKKIGQTNFLSLDRRALYALTKWIDQFHFYWGDNNETLINYQSYMKGGEKK